MAALPGGGLTAQNSAAERKKAKPRGRPFPKGTSGNPGGRPKDEREVVEAIRMRGTDLAAALLELALEERNVFAIKEALDRGYGKAKQTVELSGKDGAPISVDLSRLSTAQVKTLRELVAAATPKPR